MFYIWRCPSVKHVLGRLLEIDFLHFADGPGKKCLHCPVTQSMRGACSQMLRWTTERILVMNAGPVTNAKPPPGLSAHTLISTLSNDTHRQTDTQAERHTFASFLPPSLNSCPFIIISLGVSCPVRIVRIKISASIRWKHSIFSLSELIFLFYSSVMPRCDFWHLYIYQSFLCDALHHSIWLQQCSYVVKLVEPGFTRTYSHVRASDWLVPAVPIR